MDKLELWQRRLADSNTASAAEAELMDRRESLYRGERRLRPLVAGDEIRKKNAVHIRNIIFENVEAQVSSSIPQPKVSARRKADEHLAEIIEIMLRNEMNRLPAEQLNDMAERTVPIQGGVYFLIEWDSRTGDGDLEMTLLHPKQVAPQPGIYTGVQDMDWLILKIPNTVQGIQQKYGIKLEHEQESEPELRSAQESGPIEDAVTEYIGYERNERGGIDRFCWVNDRVLEDMANYQARRQPVCRNCGTPQPLAGTADAEEGRCPSCGGTQFVSQEMDSEAFPKQLISPGGVVIEAGAEVPYYVPGCYPLVLQRSVSVFGQLLGNSDVDVIADQQNTINRLEQKIIDRLLKAGTRITLPDRADFKMDPEDGERWYVGNTADMNLINLYEFTGNLQFEMAYLSQVYEEARQIIGVTDSFQGRRDATATSGKAKEFAAAQTAGRLESKRIMKNAAYAEIYETMFRMMVAYADEPRIIQRRNEQGDPEYLEFNRYDFLEQNPDGSWGVNDRFLFSCDSNAPLAGNREQLWQETLTNLQAGTFGDPKQTETLILYWSKMEALHYPGAGETRAYLERRQERERQAAADAAAQQQMMQQQAVIPPVQ